MIVKTRDTLRSIQVDEYGMKKIERNGIDFRASPANIKRALRIMDALFKWFEKNGYAVEAPYTDSRTYVIINGQRIGIAIEEKSTYIGEVPEKIGSYTYHRRGYKPTEKLSLLIRSYHWNSGLRKSWSDGKRGQVEDYLHEFIDGVRAMAAYEKAFAIRREQEEQHRKAELLQKKYVQKCEELEREILDKLEDQVRNWNFSMQLREYIAAVESKAKKQYPAAYPKGLSAWLEWASSHADELDPLKDFLPAYIKASDLIDINNIE